MSPLISVITPTWQRHGTLLDRCIPSVLAQDYPAVEQVIVSDGYEPELYPAMLERYGDEIAAGRIVYDELAEHSPHHRWGHRARHRGAEIAGGDLICWVDDDDAIRPHHLSMLAAALDYAGAGFAYGQMVIHTPGGESAVGTDPPSYGQIGTHQFVHRRELLEVASWRDEGQLTIDWDLIERWMAAGVTWFHVPLPTCDAYPSAFGL